jgi:hypothetical protein
MVCVFRLSWLQHICSNYLSRSLSLSDEHDLREQAEADSGKDDVASRLNIDISKPLKADEVLPSIKQYERKSRYEIEEVRDLCFTHVFMDIKLYKYMPSPNDFFIGTAKGITC